MSTGKTLAIDYSQQDSTSTFAPRPRIHSSQQAGWKNIHLAHYQMPAMETPEMVNLQHIIAIPLLKYETVQEVIFEGKRYQTQHKPKELGSIAIIPADVPFSAKWNQESSVTHCYLDPTFVAHAAYESINLEQVELNLALQKTDLLVCQIVLALQNVLETDATNSCFYADSMATALAAHCLRNYSTRKHVLQEYEDGLSKYKLKQAFEYMNTHLSENISLASVSEQLGISQFHFCRLFKQSTGMTPYAYLIRQRVERAKQLLKRKEGTMLDIAIECGFANSSHFAKHFRKYTGISPRHFRML
jgi:AraC family transcriptional regulator